MRAAGAPQQAELAPVPTEQYELCSEGVVSRQVAIGDFKGPVVRIRAKARGKSQDVLRDAWDRAWLRSPAPTYEDISGGPQVRVVDLFAGCGAMSLGLKMAADAVGARFVPELAADFEAAALAVYTENLRPAVTYSEDLKKAIDDYDIDQNTGRFVRTPRLLDLRFQRLVGKVDILIGGPPCQGHSDLNNHSRRSDPKNSLYLLMAAYAAALKPKAVIIENVPAVVHDRSGVVSKTIALLSDEYEVSADVAPVAELGVAQRRRRHVLIATRRRGVDLRATWASFKTEKRSVMWAIADLATRPGSTPFDTPSRQNAVNLERIAWLFDKPNRFDLPNPRRPVCHQSQHSYKSMYGRMYPDKPAQTITSGFGSPGQGRYIHPTERRTITPHEAARLQFFPDFFQFETPKLAPRRTQLTVMIGNAVPPKLTYVVGLAALAAIGLEEDARNGRQPARAAVP